MENVTSCMWSSIFNKKKYEEKNSNSVNWLMGLEYFKLEFFFLILF